jgi:YidC/Oxa1 family membrane protein insertase
MEQKNFFLAMGLIISFLILWSVFVIPRLAPPPQPAPITDAAVEKSQSDAPQTMGLQSSRPLSKQPIPLAETVLRDEQNEIVLWPQGGSIKSWRLHLKGQDIDLVLNSDADVLPLASFPGARYKISVGHEEAVMETTLENGVHISKILTLSPTGHLHRLSYRFQNPSSQPVELTKWAWGWGPGIGTATGETKDNARLIRALTLGKLKVHVIKPTDHAEFGRWAAIDNRYYLVAFIPKTVHPVDLAVEGTKDQTRLNLIETTPIPPHGDVTVDYELYAGPKGYTALKTYDRGLEESVDFGTFAGLGRLILSALYRLKAITGNYGIAIILLTISIQLLMFPLTVKSFKATLAMKKLQPKIAEIQARFKNDPKRLNVEMMNLYKTSGTNPFGGCLPMLLQLPIFWALFTTLRNAYELRGAPFIGWIHDLSTPDVLFHSGSFQVHALPLVMGSAMFIQQRMSGAASDPTQRQMMTMMPIMFTFMFYGFPSGLVLYWLTNNLMTMTVQWSFQRINKDPSRVIETTLVK